MEFLKVDLNNLKMKKNKLCLDPDPSFYKIKKNPELIFCPLLGFDN